MSTFVKASTYLSKLVEIIYPSVKPSSGRFKKRSIYAAGRGKRGSGIGGIFNGRGHVRGREGRGGRDRGGHVQGGRGGGSGAHENIIDISDLTRYFEDAECATLSNDTRFKGNSHDLEGYIFDCSDNKQADIFVHTLKE